jgi:hypothetical protein
LHLKVKISSLDRARLPQWDGGCAESATI